jgi:hypothetical protein
MGWFMGLLLILEAERKFSKKYLQKSHWDACKIRLTLYNTPHQTKVDWLSG